MNKKTLAFAGIASLLGLAAVSMVSANNTTDALTTNGNTSTTMGKLFKGERGERGFGGMMGRGMMMHRGAFGQNNTAIQTAIKNNDYTAFVAARNANTKKPANATVPTQEQFNQMVAVSQKREAAQTALANNDYNAFVQAITPTQEEFATRATQYKARQAAETAIANNDYTAFQAAIQGTPMEGKISQDQFAKMVARQQKHTTHTTNNP